MFVFKTGEMFDPKFIINFPTKRHWRGKSRIEDIELGLIDLRKVIVKNNIKSIAIPPLGSGLGGLNWNKVKSLIENALKSLNDVNIVIFEPKGAPNAKEMIKNKEIPKMTHTWNDRKKQFSNRQITIAVNTLNKNGLTPLNSLDI